MGIHQGCWTVPSGDLVGGRRDGSQRVFRQRIYGEKKMKVKYFADTDTALVEFTESPVTVTKEISESIYVDLDATGNLVSMTIEHAKANAGLKEFSFVEMVGKAS